MSKIAQISVSGIRYPSGSLHKTRWGAHEEACIVEIVDADGHRGSSIARCHAGRSAAAFREEIEALSHVVLGAQVDDVDGIRSVFERALHIHLAQYVSIFAVSAIDVALWDLLGVARGLPVRTLIDPAAEPVDRVPAYASLPHVHSTAQAIDVAHETYAAGFETVKLHSSGSVQLDVEIVTALRAEFGADAGMAFDAARAFSRDQARTLAVSLHELGFLWFEEPFGPFADEDCAWLFDQVPIPIAGFETAPGSPDSARWAMERGIVQRLLVDCYWKAGISGAKRVVDTAETLGQKLLVHHGASTAMNLANMQLAAVRPSLGPIELLAPFGEYDVAAYLPELAPGKGIILPTEPGLGLRWDEDFVAAHRVGDVRTIRG
ncbi:MAG: mandelate racemase/muconate lactonizing enzyme family protein [Microbacteriaceae bacterium]|uniref:mandelate racemase/muconate lactonizing enzyme family protein n=1 Tax=Microbacterium sp. JB110 TaxID=2024477 RepID=UPI00097F19BE|nr:enolase C-terminal domain-like protein [Microbacterium sp. JB110]SJM55319.1 mandelate racemase/muconate lactonizing enzyme family protein [Frigoribacterium sp. JB110]